MKKPKRPESGKKTQAKRERVLAILRHPGRYGDEERAFYERHKHLIAEPAEPSRQI